MHRSLTLVACPPYGVRLTEQGCAGRYDLARSLPKRTPGEREKGNSIIRASLTRCVGCQHGFERSEGLPVEPIGNLNRMNGALGRGHANSGRTLRRAADPIE